MASLNDRWIAESPLLFCAPPLIYLLAALAAQLSRLRRPTIQALWTLLRFAASSALFPSLAGSVWAMLHASSLSAAPRILSLGNLGPCAFSFRFDTLEALMLLLVTFLGWIIISYSRQYMAGDPNESRYQRKLIQTIFAVTLLVITNNLILFGIAWVATSLSLHGLLTLYPDRQPAVIAAHKKFLASRLGDLALFSAVLLLGNNTGSFEIDAVLGHLQALHSIPVSISLAAILFAISAIIKCAQLPLHGWLIQVMEAPTPVSALLHAGIVNLGGFMLIRLAPVLAVAPAARLLLVLSGTLTAVLASLVMTTRISIKVHLAWSTCAQMGFMLLECGLGRYDLALLHLLGHSLYKAHAFLGSGGTVNISRLKRMASFHPHRGLAPALLAACAGFLLAALAALLWQPHTPLTATTLFCLAVAGLAIAGLLAATPSARSPRAWLVLPALAACVVALYFAWEHLFHSLLPAAATQNLPSDRAALAFAISAFLLLFLLQTILRARPHGQIALALYPWFYAGLYLDELFTRATFTLWPARRLSQTAPHRDATQPFSPLGVSQ